MGFSSVPRLSGWSFQQRICGGVLPSPHYPDKSGPAVPPTDTLRKGRALTLVTSEKSTLFIGVTKIVRFCKDLRVIFDLEEYDISVLRVGHRKEIYRKF
jgi:hypothetical protein